MPRECLLYCIACGDLPDGTRTNPTTVALQAGDVVRVLRNAEGQWRLEIDRAPRAELDHVLLTLGVT